MSWNEDKFYNRANQWEFYGDFNGFVSIRPQKSGYYKLTGVAGDLTSIKNGFNELLSKNKPIWGMMTPKIAEILIKKYNFRKPNFIESKILIKLIPSKIFI